MDRQQLHVTRGGSKVKCGLLKEKTKKQVTHTNTRQDKLHTRHDTNTTTHDHTKRTTPLEVQSVCETKITTMGTVENGVLAIEKDFWGVCVILLVVGASTRTASTCPPAAAR